MQPIAATSAPRRTAGVAIHHDGPRSLLGSSPDGMVVELDPIGRAIWELCDGSTTIDEMVAAVCHVFAVGPDVAAHDISTLIQQLRQAGLVDLG